ncbi:MAG: hypothetical protein HYV59_09920 [Planctomycetes bacterium]|nr:hypothetical protein [Planctomycetota bacterium]
MDSGLAGIIGSIAGAIIGGFISWFSAIRALEKQEKYRAKTEFTDVFVDVIRLLDSAYSGEYIGAYRVLTEHFDKMSIAVLKFRQSLSQPEADKLDRLWKKLCWPDNTSESKRFLYYNVPNWKLYEKDRKVEDERRDLALKNIQKMLEIAKVE